jgi:hypothetical protein
VTIDRATLTADSIASYTTWLATVGETITVTPVTMTDQDDGGDVPSNGTPVVYTVVVQVMSNEFDIQRAGFVENGDYVAHTLQTTDIPMGEEASIAVRGETCRVTEIKEDSLKVRRRYLMEVVDV